MEKFELKADVRNSDEKLNLLRTSKQVPWVVYGHKQEPISVKIDASALLKTFRKAWESHIIVLEVWKKQIEVLIHDYQRDPVIWDFIHIDFYALTAWEKVHTKIHLQFVWESEAKKLWAIIEEHLHEIEVKCESKDLVDNFPVDLWKLAEFWDSIKISDLDIDTKKYIILTSQSEIVAHANKPAVIKEEVVATDSTETAEQ